MKEPTPYSLSWWLKMHGQCFGQAQWQKMSEYGTVSRMMKYLELGVWIEERIVKKYGE